jgi:hypothetical protein
VVNKGIIRRTEQMAKFGWPDPRTAKFTESAQRGRVRCVSAPNEVLVDSKTIGKQTRLKQTTRKKSAAAGWNKSVGVTKARGKRVGSSGVPARRRSRADDFVHDRVLPADTTDSFGHRTRSTGKHGKFDDTYKAPVVQLKVAHGLSRSQNPLTRNARFLGSSGPGSKSFSTEYGREFNSQALRTRAWA